MSCAPINTPHKPLLIQPFSPIFSILVTYLIQPGIKCEYKPRKGVKRLPRVATFERSGAVLYESSQRGNKLLHYDGHKYIKNNIHGKAVYWKCTKWHSGCKARAITNLYSTDVCYTKNVHNHEAPNSIEVLAHTLGTAE